MAQEITKAQLLALRLTRLMEAGAARPAQISLAKRNNVWMALQCARKAREILGAAGITDQYSVIRHMMNLESVSTYEGTHDIHTLALAATLPGWMPLAARLTPSFRANSRLQRSPETFGARPGFQSRCGFKSQFRRILQLRS